MPTALFSNVLLWTAAVVSFLGFSGHAFLVGSRFLEPVMANADLSATVKWQAFLSWHIVSIVLLSLAIAFGYSATHPGNRSLAIFASIMSAAISVLSILIGIGAEATLLTLPAPYVTGGIAVLGNDGGAYVKPAEIVLEMRA